MNILFETAWDQFCEESHKKAVKEFAGMCNVIGLKKYRKELVDRGHKTVAETFYKLGRFDEKSEGSKTILG